MRKAYGDRAVGERLRRARRARGWSLAELAKRLGIKPNNVWLWETGRYRIPPKRVEDVCKLLGVTPEWLLGTDADLESARSESIVRRLERIAERMEAAMQPTPRNIPVVAHAACGKDVLQLDPDRDGIWAA